MFVDFQRNGPEIGSKTPIYCVKEYKSIELIVKVSIYWTNSLQGDTIELNLKSTLKLHAKICLQSRGNNTYTICNRNMRSSCIFEVELPTDFGLVSYTKNKQTFPYRNIAIRITTKTLCKSSYRSFLLKCDLIVLPMTTEIK